MTASRDHTHCKSSISRCSSSAKVISLRETEREKRQRESERARREREGGREREGETERAGGREGERDRETERQTRRDRQTGMNRDRPTDRQTETDSDNRHRQYATDREKRIQKREETTKKSGSCALSHETATKPTRLGLLTNPPPTPTASRSPSH
jgi:hypothetical protein